MDKFDNNNGFSSGKDPDKKDRFGSAPGNDGGFGSGGTQAYNTGGASAYGGPGYGNPSGPPLWAPTKKKSKSWLTLLIVVIICASVMFMFFGCLNAVNVLQPSTDKDKNTFSPPSEKYLAKLYVVGEINNTDDTYTSSTQTFHYNYTINTIDSLIGDKNNAGLILFMNSPGGTVYESDATYLKVMEYKEKTERPVYVYMGSMAASGAYYIAAAADSIYANRNTWTGSIGVISGTFFDVSEFLENHGIKATDITSGKNKGMGSYFEPMTQEQKDILQSLVDEAYEQFVDIVATGRDMNMKEAKKLADGRIYTASQAKKNGLIDDVLGEQEAYDLMREDAGDKNMKIEEMTFKAQDRIWDLFVGMNENTIPSELGKGTDPTASEMDSVSRVLDLTENSNPFILKYLYR